jgi:hypothetical protein
MTEPIDAFQMGKAELPLGAAATGTLVRVTDPALYHLLEYLAWGLQRHIGARLAAEAVGVQAGITAAVLGKVWRDPAPLLTSEQVPTPLLAVYRKSADVAEHTQVRARELSKVEVLYALPPLTAGGLERLSPILVAAARVILNFARTPQHEAYTPPGGTLGQDIGLLSGINYCQVTSYRFGDVAAFAKGLYLPAVLLSLDLSEVETLDRTDVDALAGTDTSLDIVDPDTATTMADVVTAKT